MWIYRQLYGKNMENNMKLIKVYNELTEAVSSPKLSTWLAKFFKKIGSVGYEIESAFVHDLEKMSVAGKVVYDKYSKKLTKINFSKLDDEDYNILFRSASLRKAILESFGETKVKIGTAAERAALTGRLRKIADMYAGIPAGKVIRGGGEVVNVSALRIVKKSISNFFRNNPITGNMQKLFRKYDASMEDVIKLEKEVNDEINNALGDITNTTLINDHVKKINGLILRIRDFDKHHPKMFWNNIKNDILTIDPVNGPTLIREVESSGYYTIFRDRFANSGITSTKLPKNTIARWDGLKKIFTRPINSKGERSFWLGVGREAKKIVTLDWGNSRFVSMMTLLDTRTIKELNFNVTVRGRTMSATSYFTYKIAFVLGMVPLAKDIIGSIWDAAFINYEYTKEELKEMFNGKKSDEFWSAFCTLLSNKLGREYESPAHLLWEWSPIIAILRSDVDTDTGIDTIRQHLSEEEKKARQELKGRFHKFKVLMKATKDTFAEFFDHDEGTTVTPTPTPKPTTTTTTPTTEPLPAPPTNPNAVSEEITSAEVDAFIDTYLADDKASIVKPYTVNTDKTITLFLTGQDTPYSTIIKVGGKLTIK